MPSKRKSLILSNPPSSFKNMNENLSNTPESFDKVNNIFKSRIVLNDFNNDFNNDLINQTNNSYNIKIFGNIVGICITFFILDWIIKVHKCECANINEGLYLKEWYMFLVVYQIISLLYLIMNGYDNISGIFIFISSIISIVSIIMIIRLLIYLNKLKKIKCDCGMSTRENIIYYWYIIFLSILLFIILLALLSFLFAYANE